MEIIGVKNWNYVAVTVPLVIFVIVLMTIK